MSFVLSLTTTLSQPLSPPGPATGPLTKDFPLTTDMSVAPEIARLAEADLRAGEPTPTLGMLARHLRTMAAAPERWWSLVRFDPDRTVRITVEESACLVAWLAVIPPGAAGQDCDCDVAAMIAGEPAERAAGGTGEPAGTAVLRPGTLRVHGRRHELHGSGTGYSVSLHARAK